MRGAPPAEDRVVSCLGCGAPLRVGNDACEYCGNLNDEAPRRPGVSPSSRASIPVECLQGDAVVGQPLRGRRRRQEEEIARAIVDGARFQAAKEQRRRLLWMVLLVALGVAGVFVADHLIRAKTVARGPLGAALPARACAMAQPSRTMTS